MADIESLLKEKRTFKPSPEFSKSANWNKRTVDELRKLGAKNPERFWAKMAKENLDWFTPWKKVLDWKPPFAKWFVGAKTNVSYNCLDRHLEGPNAWRKNKAAIIWEGEPGDTRIITYGELHKEVCRFANVLKAQGVKKGDRVCLYMPMVPELTIAMLACTRIGAPHSIVFGGFSAEALSDRINDTEAKLVVTADGGYRKGAAFGLKATVDSAVEKSPCVETVIVVERTGQPVEMRPGRDVWWHDAMADASTRCPAAKLDAEHPLFILYTSGTTGLPKGAVATHRGIVGFVEGAIAGGVTRMMEGAQRGLQGEPPPPTVSLCTVPLFHMSGLFSAAILMLGVGAKTVWRLGRFDPGEVLRLIEKERITSWAALGSMAYRVVSHPDVDKYDLSSVFNVGSGGAPTSPEIQRRLREVLPRGGANMGLGYGLSESVGVISSIGGAELRERPESVGRIGLCTEIEIRDADENVLPDGEDGEIHSRSPFTMLEYWRNPEATAKAIKPGRWLATGDIGRMDDGYLYINSRARDMILRSAENIYPVEIEHRLDAHPSVAESAVIGVDHEELGQEVKAIVVPEDGSEIDTEALGRWVAEKLAAFKVPAHWEVRSEPLPRNAAGKILKIVLKGMKAADLIEE